MRYDEHYQLALHWARRRPAFWLRHRERELLARHDPGPPGPGIDELAQLAAIRRELRNRSTSRRWRR